MRRGSARPAGLLEDEGDWTYLQMLFELGRVWAQDWLTTHGKQLGKASIFDLHAFFNSGQDAL